MKKYMLNDEFCPVAKTVEIINTPWKILILYKLINGKLRFNEFKREIPNISEKMLSSSLKELEENKLIDRFETRDGSLKVEYQLTSMGQDLETIIEAITIFGDTYFKPEDKKITSL